MFKNRDGLAIEPMLNTGTESTVVRPEHLDGRHCRWRAVRPFEHTVR